MVEFLVAMLVTAALVPASAVVSRRWGAVATPRADRWSRRSVPRIGGLAITAGMLAGAAVGPLTARVLVVAFVGILVMAALGLADDLRSVPPVARLLVQGMLGAGVGTLLAWRPELTSGVLLVVALSTITVPLLANATNLVDNADGLAASLSAVSGLALAAIGAVAGLPEASAVGLVLAGAGVGFLLHNRPPAGVFMGDVGSLPLGLGVAVATLLVVVGALDGGRADAPALLIAVPAAWAFQLGDLAMVLVTRLRRGVSPLRGNVDHTSHRLMRAGLGPRATLSVLSALALAAGSIGVVAAASRQPAVALMLVIGVALGVAAFEVLLARSVPFDEAHADVARPRGPTRRAPRRPTEGSEQG